MISRRSLSKGMICVFLLPLMAVARGWPASAAVELGDAPRVVSRLYGELPEDKRVSIEFDRDSELNQWIRQRMVLEMEGRGYEVVEGAAQVLSFRSQLRSDHDSGTRFSLQAESGISRRDTLLLDYTVPLGERPGIGSSTYFSVTATLGYRGKRALWQGTSSAKARHRRAVELQPDVVTALTNAIGKTVGGDTY